jgi:hypothetical protein
MTAGRQEKRNQTVETFNVQQTVDVVHTVHDVAEEHRFLAAPGRARAARSGSQLEPIVSQRGKRAPACRVNCLSLWNPELSKNVADRLLQT